MGDGMHINPITDCLDGPFDTYLDVETAGVDEFSAFWQTVPTVGVGETYWLAMDYYPGLSMAGTALDCVISGSDEHGATVTSTVSFPLDGSDWVCRSHTFTPMAASSLLTCTMTTTGADLSKLYTATLYLYIFFF